MKKIIHLVALVLFSNVIKAQVPAFPSVDAAFAKVVLANYDEEIFKATGLHANKFKMLGFTFNDTTNGNHHIRFLSFNHFLGSIN